MLLVLVEVLVVALRGGSVREWEPFLRCLELVLWWRSIEIVLVRG